MWGIDHDISSREFFNYLCIYYNKHYIHPKTTFKLKIGTPEIIWLWFFLFINYKKYIVVVSKKKKKENPKEIGVNRNEVWIKVFHCPSFLKENQNWISIPVCYIYTHTFFSNSEPKQHTPSILLMTKLYIYILNKKTKLPLRIYFFASYKLSFIQVEYEFVKVYMKWNGWK